jgi:ankyrin repeat protein
MVSTMQRFILSILSLVLIFFFQGCGGNLSESSSTASASKTVDVNARDQQGKTPLWVAIENGQKDVVADLLSKGANIQDGFQGEKPIHLACRVGNKEIVDLLLGKGADPLYKTQSDFTCLHFASTRLIAELLVSKGLDVNVQTNYRERPIHLAAERGNLEVVQFLLEKGADPLARSRDMDVIPLNYASTRAVAEVLVAAGAPVNGVPNENGRNTAPIYSAAEKGRVEVVEYLADQGAQLDVETYGGSTPIYAAVDKGHADVVAVLLKKGAQPIGAFKNSVLPAAVKKGNRKIVELLLDGGVNPSAQASDLPLNLAAAHAYPEILELLLDRGADVHGKSGPAYTALHEAANTRHRGPAHRAPKEDRTPQYTQCVEILIKRGADVRAATNNGLTPLHLAASCNFKAGAELLLAAGAEVEAKAQFDATPLHWAVINDAPDVAQLLLEKGANVHAALSGNASIVTSKAGDIPNPFKAGEAADGKTALTLAKPGMKALLEKHAAK